MTKARVLYDGDCAFCCKSIELLKKLDWLGQLDRRGAAFRADARIAARRTASLRRLSRGSLAGVAVAGDLARRAVSVFAGDDLSGPEVLPVDRAQSLQDRAVHAWRLFDSSA